MQTRSIAPSICVSPDCVARSKSTPPIPTPSGPYVGWVICSSRQRTDRQLSRNAPPATIGAYGEDVVGTSAQGQRDTTPVEFDSMARDKEERVCGYLSVLPTAQETYPLMLIT